MNDLWSVLRDAIGKLEKSSIEYMLVGSLASSSYGDPRLTRDVDLVVELKPSDTARLVQIFPEVEYYVPPAQVLSDEIQGRRQFNLIHLSSSLKLDFMVRKESPHGKEEFSRRRRFSIAPGLEVSVASPEDVILKKLEYFREGGSEKHLRDIQGILANQVVDRAYLEAWVERLALRGEWTRAQGLNS